MTSSKFWNFISRHTLLAYLGLIPPFVLAVISPSPLTIGIFLIQVIVILTGTFVMYRKYGEDLLIESSKKLKVFTKYFMDEIIDSQVIYSLPCIALEVASNDAILKNRVWYEYLLKLYEDLTNKIYALYERIEKDNGKEFKNYLEDFQKALGSLQEFKRKFYEMVHEIGEINFATNFGLNAKFKARYTRLHDKFNSYMNNLETFSYDIEASLGVALNKKLIEHIYNLSELCKTIYP